MDLMGNVAVCKCSAKINREGWMTEEDWDAEVEMFKEEHNEWPCEVTY